jgi:hypothetical protein
VIQVPDKTTKLSDNEIVLRHVPEINVIGLEVVSSNFELRSGEKYSSVSIESITSADKLLGLLKTTSGSRIAAARIGDIRAMGLRVEPYPSKRNPGHAGIESDAASLDDELTRIRLAELFTYRS